MEDKIFGALALKEEETKEAMSMTGRREHSTKYAVNNFSAN